MYFLLHFLNSENDETVCDLRREFSPAVDDIVWLPGYDNAWKVRQRWIAFDHRDDPRAVVMTIFVLEQGKR